MRINLYLMGRLSTSSNKHLVVFTGTYPEYSVEGYSKAVLANILNIGSELSSELDSQTYSTITNHARLCSSKMIFTTNKKSSFRLETLNKMISQKCLTQKEKKQHQLLLLKQFFRWMKPNGQFKKIQLFISKDDEIFHWNQQQQHNSKQRKHQ